MKCTQCDSWQDWRGGYFSGAASVILPMLVALVAVITAAVPALRWLFTTDRANVHLSIVKSDPSAPAHFRIIAANVGTLAAVIDNPQLIVHRGTQPDKVVPLVFTEENLIIQRAGAKPLNLTLDMRLPTSPPKMPCTYEVLVSVTDYKRAASASASQPCYVE